MGRRSLLTMLAVALVASLPAGIQGQQSHAVERGELESAVAEHDAAADERRQSIRSVLEHPEVERVAEANGIELTRVEDAVATLEGEALATAAVQADRVQHALAGGDASITITTTALVIALLILIVILVA